jgi:hypothetical protein
LEVQSALIAAVERLTIAELSLVALEDVTGLSS